MSAICMMARSSRDSLLCYLVSPAYDDESPSNVRSARGTTDELLPLGARRASGGVRGHPNREISRRSFSGSASARAKRSGTFLTECSFGVAHDRLVAMITDVQPFEPYWEKLASIDLSSRGLDSVARLKEFLPRLDSLAL